MGFNTHMKDFLDEKICPLCRRGNRCQAEGRTCWCFDLSIPKELIEMIPERLRNKACICEYCVTEFQRDPESFRVWLEGEASKP